MTRDTLKYSTYELFDFLLDPDFKQWVQHPDDELNECWHAIINANPTQYHTIQQAIKIIKNLPPVNQNIHTERKNVLWAKIEEKINDPFKIQPKKLRLDFVKYAAAILIVVVTASSIWFHQRTTSLIQIVTGNGEIKSLLLPDGSTVYLAPNSSISYHKNLAENEQREIWATGDVRFDVKHINQNPKAILKGERFIVHLGQKINIEVLGTVFNVSSRLGNSSVELISGVVRVNRNHKQFMLKPGESAFINAEEQLEVSNKVLSISREWEQQTVSLNRTSVEKILELLKNTYGIELKVENKSILKKEIDGVLPLNDSAKALEILTHITSTDLQVKDGTYVLKARR